MAGSKKCSNHVPLKTTLNFPLPASQNTLEIAMADVMAEMDLCLQLKASLEQREAKVLEKQSVNEARLKVKEGGGAQP